MHCGEVTHDMSMAMPFIRRYGTQKTAVKIRSFASLACDNINTQGCCACPSLVLLADEENDEQY